MPPPPPSSSSSSSSKFPKSKPRHSVKPSLIALSDAASFCCAVGFIALILMTSFRPEVVAAAASRTQLVERRPCDEIYVVAEGETLHTISDKCGDPYIVERNPHIHDPDDVFPGLVLKILPSHQFEP